MKFALCLALVLVSVAHSAAADGAEVKVTPVQKVIQLLNGMLEKGKSEADAEQVQFAAFKQFCDDTTVEKKRAIEEANEMIEILKADIQKYAADAEQLAKEIAEHEEDIAVWTGDIKAATKVREIEKTDYDATHKDYTESIEALQMAIEVLKKQAYDRPQAASLEKEEMNARHAFEMLMQNLKAQIEQATQDRDEKAAEKAKKLQAKADAEGELEDTITTRDADAKYLADLTATCEQKASDFESRQQLRAEEIEAIEKAIEIISSEAVQGNAEKHLPTLLQAKAASLAQLRADGRSPTQQRVAQYLQDRSRELNSRVLSALAVRAADDPFKKVKKMIKDLIVKLMEEAAEEAEHKGWCDTELSTNEQTRKEKTGAVEMLHAEIDQLQASIAQLGEDITALSKSVAELDTAMAKATTMRQSEKAENEATIKDAQDAQTAVAQALVVLKEFYAKAAESTALVQQEPTAPSIFDSPYQGMAAENGGVIGMLEVIESDFARLEAETSSAEATAQKTYDEFMTTSKVDKAAKTTSSEHKAAKKQDEEQALTTKNGDLEGTQKELDAALAYYDKLKPSCVDSGVSYEDRVGRRKEEIESLQEALRILNGEDL